MKTPWKNATPPPGAAGQEDAVGLSEEGRRGSNRQSDEVERALAVLRTAPYTPSATEEQERACSVLYRHIIAKLSRLCERLGLDEEEAINVVHGRFLRFVTAHVARVGPTAEDFERWMWRVCTNAAWTVLKRQRTHTKRTHEAVLEYLLEVEDHVTDDPGGLPDETSETASSEEPNWLDAPFPRHVDPQRFLLAVDSLTPGELRLLKVAFRHAKTRRAPYRLPATEVARELGITPGAASVRWNGLMKKLNQNCGGSSNASS